MLEITHIMKFGLTLMPAGLSLAYFGIFSLGFCPHSRFVSLVRLASLLLELALARSTSKSVTRPLYSSLVAQFSGRF